MTISKTEWEKENDKIEVFLRASGGYSTDPCTLLRKVAMYETCQSMKRARVS